MSKQTKKKAEWLREVSENKQGTYRHRLFKEQVEHKDHCIEELKSLIEAAHDDAYKHFTKTVYGSLDPLEEESSHPEIEYPKGLHFNNLKGYFGEILAAYIIVEREPFESAGWQVPVFRFRLHNVAFEQLMLATQTGGDTKKVPGLTGEDCVGFLVDENWNLIKFVVAEAKCTGTHDASMIKDAHSQVGKHDVAPTVIPQLIDIVKSQEHPDAEKWVQLLRQIFLKPAQYAGQRMNLVVYTCSQLPKGNRASWMSSTSPHSDYSSSKPLEVAEIHLNDVNDLIKKSYGLE